MILAHRHLRRVAQSKPAALPQKSRLAIAPRQLRLATLAQPLQAPRNLRQSLFQFLDLHPRPRTFVRIAGVARLLPAPNLPPDLRPLLPQTLLRIDPISRSLRPYARRIDGHRSQPSQAQLP